MSTGPASRRRSISEHGILFVLFGYPVRIQWWFFVGATVLGLSGHRDLLGLVVWIAVAGMAILIHELGHAIAARSIGAFPTIELHALGGLTRWTAPLRSRWVDRVLVSLAGPGLGSLGILAYSAFNQLLGRPAIRVAGLE
jgi:stage IV sporulation protein FB